MPVKVQTAKARKVDDTTDYVATLKSRDSAVVMPQVEGIITQIFVHSGERVASGAPMMQIDPAKQQATVKSQEDARAAQVARSNGREQNYERVSGLANAGVVSKQDLDQARATIDAAQAQLHSLDAQVSEQQVQLHYYQVVAPRAGIVGDVPVRAGDRVVTTTALTTVDRPGSLEAYIYIPIEKSAQLKMNLPVQIVDASGNSLATSRITFISPQVDTSTQTVLAKATDRQLERQPAHRPVHPRPGGLGQPGKARCSGHSGVANRRPLLRFRGRARPERRIRGPPEAAPDRPNRRQRLRRSRRRETGRQSSCFRHPISNRWRTRYPAGRQQLGSRDLASGDRCHREAFEHRSPERRFSTRTNCSLWSTFLFTARYSPPSARCSLFLRARSASPPCPSHSFPTSRPRRSPSTAVYTGASSQTVESAVTTPLEQQINGAEGMNYITSSSTNAGVSTVTATFDLNRDPDLAAVDIENRVNTASGRLPAAVKQVGVTVAKTSQNFVFGAPSFRPTVATPRSS